MAHKYSQPIPECDYRLLNQAVCKVFYDCPLLTDPQKAAIQSILQANLASGRTYRRFKGHLQDRAEGLIVAYITSVVDYYLRENPILISLHRGYPEAWLDLMDWLTRCAHVKLQYVHPSKGVHGRSADDFAQEISLWLFETFSQLSRDAEDSDSPAAGKSIGYTFDVPFSDWIAKVQSRRIADAVRDAVRHNLVPISAEVETISSEDTLSHSLDHVTLEQEISRLTWRQKRVMELYAQGLDTEQVSEQLGCTNRAVYNRRHAAVHRLRDELAESTLDS